MLLVLLLGAGCDTGFSGPDPTDESLALLWRMQLEQIDGISLRLRPEVIQGRLLFNPYNELWAVDPTTGDVLWKHDWPKGVEVSGTYAHRWTVSPDSQTVFIRAHEGQRLEAVDVATGQVRWSTGLPEGQLFLDLNVGAVDEQSVFMQATEGWLYRFDRRDGRVLWHRQLDERPRSLARWGSLLFVAQGWGGTGKESGRLLALDAATGEERWRFDLEGWGGFVYAAIQVEGDRLYAGAQGGGDKGAGMIVCLDAATGAVRWRLANQMAFDLIVARTAHGLRLFLNDGAGVVALNAETGRRLWRYGYGGSSVNNVFYTGGVVYHSHYGPLQAFEAETGRLLGEAMSPESGYGYAVWSDGERLYWLTDTQLEARRPFPTE